MRSYAMGDGSGMPWAWKSSSATYWFTGTADGTALDAQGLLSLDEFVGHGVSLGSCMKPNAALPTRVCPGGNDAIARGSLKVPGRDELRITWIVGRSRTVSARTSRTASLPPCQGCGCAWPAPARRACQDGATRRTSRIRPLLRARRRIKKDASDRLDVVRIQSDMQLRAHWQHFRIAQLLAFPQPLWSEAVACFEIACFVKIAVEKPILAWRPQSSS